MISKLNNKRQDYIEANRMPNESAINATDVPPVVTSDFATGSSSVENLNNLNYDDGSATIDISTSSLTKWLTSPLGLVVIAVAVYILTRSRK